MNPTIKIIDYNDKYALDTVQMWRESMETALGVKDKHSLAEQLHYLQNVVIKENQTYLAIDTQTDKVVGLLAVAGSELNQLYVHVAYQDAGIGTHLLNLAKELSPGKLQLYAFEVNKKAQAFYEKHGFSIIGRGFEPEWKLADIRYEWAESPGLE
jgi:ribosomal protein S18 acetylase RimI-like enzyme